jgi:hypothetical protein
MNIGLAIFLVAMPLPAPPIEGPTIDYSYECGSLTGQFTELCPMPWIHYRVCKKYWQERETDIELYEFCGPPPQKRKAQ